MSDTALTPEAFKRVFTFKGRSFEDPAPDASPATVQTILALREPELTNAAIEGPVIAGGVATYRFSQQIGTKG